MLAIKNNLMADHAGRRLSKTYESLGRTVAKLASGQRIVTAGDDAAGMAVKELVRADVAMLRQGGRNARDAVSMCQSAEGGLAVMDDLLVRMQELAQQAATESYSSDQRAIMDHEFHQLVDEIDRIAANTTFNGLNLLDESVTTHNIMLGSYETIDIVTADMTAAGMGVGGRKAEAVHAITKGAIHSPGNAAEALNVSAGVLRIGFTPTTGQASLDVEFTSGSYTLKQVLDEINEVSRVVDGESYEAARLRYDDTTGQYGIELRALWGAADNNMNVTFSAYGASAGELATSYWSTTAGTGDRISIADATSAIGALHTLGEAQKTKDVYRARLGQLMNRLEDATTVIEVQSENLLAAESRIGDADVASEMAAMTRYQVLAQAGLSILKMANSTPEMALQLLQ